MMHKIVIGTANFGMDYGIGNNQKKLLDSDILDIISVAKKKGIETIDTAVSYGNSLKRLGEIGINDFKIITKFPRIPVDKKNQTNWFDDQVSRTLEQLGISSLEAILLHYPKDILENKNFELIHFLSNLKKDGVIKKIGVSIYEKNELEEILKIFKPEIIQCPINLFDNRLLEKNYLEEISNKGIEVHIRSIFLQGLLLFKKEEMPQDFLKFQNIWQEWYNWLKIIKLNPLEACIRYTNSIKGVDKIVVGINSAHQLKQIIKYMRKPKLYKEPNWQNPISTKLIDPRLWK
ncbi:MAG: aldo/keto reductase [Paracoccaceae bacterium]|tara:strand:+ start:1050 stop:1919 length:870 start_codon:yes stop_codon:yes gene_type:complete